MRIAHLALCSALVLGLSGCSAVLSAQQGTLEGQRNAATDAAAKSAISAAKVSVLSYSIENPGSMPTIAQLADYGYTPYEGVKDLTITGSVDDFCIEATSAGDAVFHATATGSVTDGPCS